MKHTRSAKAGHLINRTLALLTLLLAACTSPQQAQLDIQRQRAGVAKVMFEERCKKAGVFIHRKVADVDGFLVMKLRPRMLNYGSQFELDDPYGSDLGGDGYLVSFLRGSFQANTTGTLPRGSPSRLGFHFIEAIDPVDGKRYRYTGRLEEPWQHDKSFLKGYIRFVMDKAPAPGDPPAYGLTYDDISTREEREYWIAGSSLRVVDTRTGEVLAERIGYMWDPAQGSKAGGRSPWLLAANHACPSFYRMPGQRPDGRAFAEQPRQAQDFIESVLVPRP